MANNIYFDNRPGASLPDWIRARMIELGIKPSLSKLALGAGIPISTLQQNFAGRSSMKLSTAKRIATFLEISIEKVAERCE